MLAKHLLAMPVLALTLAAQGAPITPSSPVTAAQRQAVVESLAVALRANYVFPDVAEKVSQALVEKAAHGGYDRAITSKAFADALTKDLREQGKDLHFLVEFDPAFKSGGNTDKPSTEELADERREIAHHAFGIQRVERLEGNVGYLEIRGFGPPEIVGPALSSAMTILSGTDALILDLRRNGGGAPDGVADLLSHFFEEGDSRHLNSIYFRPANSTQQFWTIPSASPRYTKPVYVLTSARTFSAGEECAYDFQTQKRATLVGETTRGGANPGDLFPLTNGYVAFISTGRAINPITHTNWEGVGVKPDLAAPAADALKTAHATILKTFLLAAKDPDLRKELEDLLVKVEKGEVTPPTYRLP